MISEKIVGKKTVIKMLYVVGELRSHKPWRSQKTTTTTTRCSTV